jgi:hypothetical protein
MLQGWEVERTDMAAFKDIVDAFKGLDSDSKTPYRKAEDLFGAFAGLFGIPLKNMMRTGREVYNFFENILDDDTPSTEKVGEAFVGKKTASDVNDALKSGKTEKAKEIIDEIIESKSRDATDVSEAQKKAKASIKASVTAEWKSKYLEAYASQNNTEMARIRKLLHSTGLYDDVIETCREWVKNSQE